VTPVVSRAPPDLSLAGPIGFESVAVIGVGLMGGSLARALRALPEPPEVVGFSPDREERRAALSAGALDRAVERAEDAAGAAELIVYAAPLSAILELRARHLRLWRPDAVISDLSSLQAPLAAQAVALGFASRCLSAHPLVGREGSGFARSHAELFRGATVCLSGGAPGAVRDRFEALWTALGARTRWMEPEAHDLRMVRASHLPQLLANVLASHLESGGLARDELGSGGRDMTRLAGSSPRMWKDLLEHSAPLLAPALREIGADLDALATLLEAHDVEGVARVMERTRAWAVSGAGAGTGSGGASSREDGRS
jgi:prephenate dehydrogenase